MTAEKFDFLMHFTHTTNKVFAHGFSFDVSYISKIRKGKRKLPDSIEFSSEVALFFAQQIRLGGLEETASYIINDGKGWPSDTDDAARLIFHWSRTEDTPSPPELPAMTFLGNKGRRDAFLYAFESLCKRAKQYDLLVYSDETLNWFSEDESFFTAWSEYCLKLAGNGSTFTVISYLNRNMNDLQEGFCMWLPLVLTGAVRIFTCSVPNDSVFNRTLCIARDTMAISSVSLRMSKCPSVNTLYSDQETIRSLSSEFDTYLSMCSPLFRAFSFDDSPILREQIRKFDAVEEDLISMGTSAALYALSGSLCEDIVQRTGCTALKTAVCESAASVRRLLSDDLSVTCVLRLPPKEELTKGKVPLPMRSLYGNDEFFFEPGEYLRYLENLLTLASENSKFRLILYSGKRLPEKIDLELKASAGAVIDTLQEDDKVLFVTEPALLSPLRKLIAITTLTGEFLSLSKHTVKSYINDVRKLIDC